MIREIFGIMPELLGVYALGIFVGLNFNNYKKEERKKNERKRKKTL